VSAKFVTEKMAKATDKLLFWTVVLYLPFSIFWIFWLYSVSIIFLPDAWPYRLFYGEHGNIALLWLFAVLLPALLFLVSKARGAKLLSLVTGATGFYCLLGSLLSSHVFLVTPGLVSIAISMMISRHLKKQK